MSAKKVGKQIDVNSRWAERRAEISKRIKSAGIKLKNIYKAKLGDDMRTFEYIVIKIDRISGEVSLKNERATVRKVHVLDKLFGERK